MVVWTKMGDVMAQQGVYKGGSSPGLPRHNTILPSQPQSKHFRSGRGGGNYRPQRYNSCLDCLIGSIFWLFRCHRGCSERRDLLLGIYCDIYSGAKRRIYLIGESDVLKDLLWGFRRKSTPNFGRMSTPIREDEVAEAVERALEWAEGNNLQSTEASDCEVAQFMETLPALQWYSSATVKRERGFMEKRGPGNAPSNSSRGQACLLYLWISCN
jgi:hypothetical protein